MDEIMKLVTEKVGLSDEQAESAVGAIMEFLKEKLPAPVVGQLEGFLSGGVQDPAGLGGLGGNAGGGEPEA